MGKRSLPKTLWGLLLILLVIVAYFAIIAIMGYKAGGGIIFIFPVFLTLKYLWNKLVVQKVKIPTQIIKENLVDIPGSEVEEMTGYSANIDHLGKVSANTNTSRGYFTRVVDLLTFQSPTYRSVFDEGHRRIVMVVSLIAPFMMAYIWFYDIEDGNVDSEWYLSFPLFYIIFHLIVLVYIWIREGQGTVKPGGNALKTVRNFILPLFISGIIIVAGAIFYDTVYIPKRQEREMRNKFEQYHANLVVKDWTMMKSILAYNVNNTDPIEYLESMKNDLKGKEFLKWDISDIRLVNTNIIVGKFKFTLRTKKGTYSKSKKTTITFTNYHNDTQIEKVEIEDQEE